MARVRLMVPDCYEPDVMRAVHVSYEREHLEVIPDETDQPGPVGSRG